MPAFLLALLAATPPEAPHWRVDWSESRCMVIREGGSTEPSIAIRYVPADRRAEVWIVDPRWDAHAVPDPGSVRLVLQPAAGEPLKGFHFMPIGASGRYALASVDAPSGFIDAFAKSSAVSIERGGKPLLRIETPAADKAVAATHQCEDDLLRRWGVDPVIFRNLKREPKPTDPVNWISQDDYPAKALQESKGGTTIVRVNITAEGRVAGCNTVSSSGSKDLDAATCRAALRRRYTPALGPDGTPVPALTIFFVTWSIG
jgi:TonB family protein